MPPFQVFLLRIVYRLRGTDVCLRFLHRLGLLKDIAVIQKQRPKYKALITYKTNETL